VAFAEREPITARGYVAIGWAGMRGVVTVAAAQTIPAGTEHRATVVLAAFLVALITLVFFGLTLPLVITRMRFAAVSSEEKLSSFQALLRQVGESAVDTLGPLEEQTIDGERIDPELADRLKQQVLPRILAGVREVRDTRADSFEQTLIIQRRYLDAMRDGLASERSIGAYSSETYRQVESMLDSYEQRIGRA
jgi:monovalent cation/hydrogen antiporter